MRMYCVYVCVICDIKNKAPKAYSHKAPVKMIMWQRMNTFKMDSTVAQHNTTQHITIQNTMPLRISAYTQYIHYFNEILSLSLSPFLFVPFSLLSSFIYKCLYCNAHVYSFLSNSIHSASQKYCAFY